MVTSVPMTASVRMDPSGSLPDSLRFAQSIEGGVVESVWALRGARNVIDLGALALGYFGRQFFDDAARIARVAFRYRGHDDAPTFDVDFGLNIAMAARAPAQILPVFPQRRSGCRGY